MTDLSTTALSETAEAAKRGETAAILALISHIEGLTAERDDAGRQAEREAETVKRLRARTHEIQESEDRKRAVLEKANARWKMLIGYADEVCKVTVDPYTGRVTHGNRDLGGLSMHTKGVIAGLVDRLNDRESEVSRLTAELVEVRAERDTARKELSFDFIREALLRRSGEKSAAEARADTLAAENARLIAVAEAAATYRQAETDGTPRMWRGKDLHDLAGVLDDALAALSSGEQTP
jgi:hypothetical protein